MLILFFLSFPPLTGKIHLNNASAVAAYVLDGAGSCDCKLHDYKTLFGALLCEHEDKSKEALRRQQEEITKLQAEVLKLKLVPLKRQTTVFSFEDTEMQSFEQHKRAFGTKYYDGKDINFNDRKMIDFHEDVMKQMYVEIQELRKRLEVETDVKS